MYLNLGSGFLEKNPLAVVSFTLLISLTGMVIFRHCPADVKLPIANAIARTSFYKLCISLWKSQGIKIICPLLKVAVLCFLNCILLAGIRIIQPQN